jgi:hypothetical protein
MIKKGDYAQSSMDTISLDQTIRKKRKRNIERKECSLKTPFQGSE